LKPNNTVRGSGSERSQPATTPVDGTTEKTNVDGKDPAFHYCWLHPQRLGTELNSQLIPDGMHAGVRVAGYTRCKQESEGEEWVGYRSVRDGSGMSATDICNGELVLFKKPRRDYEIHMEWLEEMACRAENREPDIGSGGTMKFNLEHTRTIGALPSA